MLYCPPNVTILDVWTNHGTSQCFMDTVCGAVLGGFMLLAGTTQWCVYKKYATPIALENLTKTRLYGLQVALLLLMPVLEITRFVLQAVMLNEKTIYGYMIVYLCLISLAYVYSLHLLSLERRQLLPSVPTKGHGLVLLVFWSLAFIGENLAFLNLGHKGWWFHLNTRTDEIEMALFVMRYMTCLGIFVLGLRAPGIAQSADYLQLNDGRAHVGGRTGAAPDENRSTWRNMYKKMRTLLPFLWPKKDCVLQMRVMICFVLLAGGRVINLYVPIYNKMIVDSMTILPLLFRWDLILMYVAFKFLQGGGTGGMGLLNNLRTFLWIRVQQYTTREVELALFAHLHGLSLRWHLGRKTGEVLRVMDRGTDSINNLLNYILFSIAPTIIDIIVACIFFITAFNAWFGLIVFVTMSLYIGLTILVTEWRTKFQRRMNLADNATRARSVDSLLNFETVKYYGAEEFEVGAFRSAVLNFQEEEFKSNITLNILNTVQNLIINGGLLAGSLLCVHFVVDGEGDSALTVGDYVLFASYIIQLYVPLNWFGTYYRAIQKNFVDMENMFDLLAENQEVIDAPDACPLKISHGLVQFNNVCFSYVPEQTVLRNVTFTVGAGKTVALVGPSGSGKSTIIRLLFRFYDVGSGSISIDGQNIKLVQQASLRQVIGVVPQDTVLFNNTIQYNIRYGRISASEADVIAAARAADIHEKILTFPDTYETQVGERGLRLSGGEKQRVAIARTILKSPAIVLLDEATSALDTQTERNIQGALNQVCNNRTTIIVAHRLSTIIHADEILVLEKGEIVERGRHEHLLGQDGIYAAMWRAQLEAAEDNGDTNHIDTNGI